uniref:Phosphatidic acid phosphatase type 2/haloperoxidase domain-containing protein n=1 Tax=viral metagenome TaxID=1070528 RepID=A0A6C0I7A0_9ZZZZ
MVTDVTNIFDVDFINDFLGIKFDNMEFTLPNLIHLIGYLTPTIMLVITVLLLRNKINYLSFFLYGYIINIVINSLLKWFIKEPRPTNDWKILQLGITHNKRIGFDKYGMPSGHAQHCGFMLAFATLVFNSPLVTGLYSILSLICLYQRYLYQNHTLLQVIIGFVIGLGIGYLFYELGAKKLIGNIKMRPDDNGPL